MTAVSWQPIGTPGDYAAQEFMDWSLGVTSYTYEVNDVVQGEIKITPKFLIIDNLECLLPLTLTLNALQISVPAATRNRINYPEGLRTFTIASLNTTGISSVIVSETEFVQDVSNQTVASTTPVSGGALETGMLVDWSGGSTVPTGYLLCDGAPHSRATYTALDALYSALGYPYGAGDGVNTFNVPDYRGRVSIGLDNMGGSSANRITDAYADTLGGAGGAEDHALTIAELAAHTHTVTSYQTDTGVGTNALQRQQVAAGDTSQFATSSTGSGNAHPNVQPSIAINKIVKT